MSCDKGMITRFVALLGLVLASSPALPAGDGMAEPSAQAQTAEMQLRRAENLSGLEYQVQVLEQRVKISELEAKLRGVREAQMPAPAPAPAQPSVDAVGPGIGGVLAGPAAPTVAPPRSWWVLGIYGTPGHLSADITDGQSVLKVVPGDRVGVYRITGITDRWVEVKPSGGEPRQWRVGDLQ